ncbi:MAG: FxsA family protein [Myxococcales bacterium]|nr:FxsA family protein [Myxococcales bacterium]MCB9519283.1 FxsA family protein [Myxococcales bacterium]MCB9530727.1 FxsA family protein [Myxococcales bacterium]MCB9533379.1 FxsA family protein [Myxococcales bacterium]
MLARLFLLFTVTTTVELAILVQLGRMMGFAPTLGLVLVTGALGAALARREGLRTLGDIQRSLAAGELPTDGLLDGVCILLAGALLVTPGVLTDMTGFLLLIPASRGWLRRRIAAQLGQRIQAGVTSGSLRVVSFGGGFGGPPGAYGPPPTSRSPRPGGTVIDVTPTED